MKALFFGLMMFLCVSAADELDGFLMKYVQSLEQPHTNQKPSEKEKHGLEHADSAPVIASEAEVLEGPAQDPQESLKNKSPILASADVPNPAKKELKEQEEKQDLKYGPMQGKNSLEDESHHLIDLDLGLLNSNPEGTSAVRNAAPTAAGA